MSLREEAYRPFHLLEKRREGIIEEEKRNVWLNEEKYPNSESNDGVRNVSAREREKYAYVRKCVFYCLSISHLL